jgi:hypothetical protein
MKHPSRSGWLTVLAAVIGIIGALGLGVGGYWRYANSLPPFRPPLPSLPRPNGYDVALKAVDRLAARHPEFPHDWPKVAPEQLRTLLAPVRPLLNQVRSSFRLEWRARPVLRDQDYPNFSHFLKCARCFTAESLLASSRGDDRAAMERALDAVELGSRVPKGGCLVARLIGGGCQSIGFQVVEPLVPRLPQNEVEAALERVRRVRRNWPPLAETMECERVMELASLREQFANLRRLPLQQQLETLRNYQEEPTLFVTVRLALAPRRMMLAGLDQYWQRRAAESRKPLPKRTLVPTPDDPWLQITLQYVKDEPEFNCRFEWPVTQLAILEVALAVQLYRLQHGCHPVDLHAIKRRWLPTVPVDQWDQPVAYRLKRGKPVIYSLGPNRKDEGGLAVSVRHLGKPVHGDLVFGKLTWSAWPE